MDSSPPEQDAELAISLPMRQWHIIDGTVDNEINSRYERPDWEDIRTVGMTIREAGWHQVAGMTPGTPRSGAWPPDDEVVTVKLPRSCWRWVVAVLEHWAQVSDEIDRPEAAIKTRTVGKLIQSHLTVR
ncbi:hypothetical protein [Actinomadura montaniterrae]|uniref:Uncharacterized protein n=1 Tax=Actinomadura montaniterrae TaxID=1803903 RepID=A0A6L3VMY3_9ACTN|nr:hypothetical protein [Actinomadura montaniterrae]KAB2369630.1 hypothetical protein F9B16_36655 [Actinomadura montaniterrae]